MKNWIAVILSAVVLMTAFVGCGPKEEESIVGKWECYAGGDTDYGTTPAEVFLDNKLILNVKNDGTAKLSGDMDSDLIWGPYKDEKNVYVFTFKEQPLDNPLALVSVTEDEEQMVFTFLLPPPEELEGLVDHFYLFFERK